MAEMTRLHIARVRKLPGFELALAVLIVESNMSGKPVGILHALRDMEVTDLYMMREDLEPKHGQLLRPGSRTMEDNKIYMVEMLKELLENKRVMIHEKFVWACPEVCDHNDILRELIDQLRYFLKYLVTKRIGGDEVSAYHYSGKKSGKLKDDMTMSFSDNVYRAALFLSSDRYASVRAKYTSKR